MTRIAQALTATALVIAGLTTTLPARAQDKPPFKPTFNATFTKGKRPAADVPVTIVPGGSGNDLIDVGRTTTAGALTLDLAIGGLRPGKPMKVTQRECKDSGTSVFLGDEPTAEKRCRDRLIAAFFWGDGDHTFSLASGGGVNWSVWGPILAAAGGAGAIPAFRNGDGSNNGGQTPGGQTPGGGTGGGGTGGGGTGGGGTTPGISSLNGNYVGTFIRISDTCSIFVPSFTGTLNITATDSGSMTSRLMEQITFVHTGAMQLTSAGNGSGSGMGSGTLPGNIPYNSQITFTIANNRATAEDTITIPSMGNCVARRRGTDLVKQ